MADKYYVARYNMSWQCVKDKKLYGDKIALKDGEKLRDYTQVPKSKDDSRQKAQTKQGKKSEGGDER